MDTIWVVHLCTQLSRVLGHPTPPFRCGLFAPTAGAGLTQPGVWGSAGLERRPRGGVNHMLDGVPIRVPIIFIIENAARAVRRQVPTPGYLPP